MKYVVLLLFPAFYLQGMVRVWPERLSGSRLAERLRRLDPPVPPTPSRRLQEFLSSFRERVPSLPGDHATSERILHLSDAIQRRLCEASASPEQVLGVCNSQFLDLLDDFNQILPTLTHPRVKRDVGLVAVQLQSLLETTQKREQLVAIAASATEKKQTDAWFLKEALSRSQTIAVKGHAAFRRVGSGVVGFLSQNDFESARNSPALISQVRLLQALRFLRKVLRAYHQAILSLSKALGGDSPKFERRLAQFFRNKNDKKVFGMGLASLGFTAIAKKHAHDLQVIQHLDKEYRERSVYLSRVSNNNSSLFDTLRRMRNCSHRVDAMTKSIKSKLQIELELS